MCSATQREGIWAQLGATRGFGVELAREKSVLGWPRAGELYSS